MRWNIGKRLFVALTIASLLIVGLNAIATRWSFQSGFIDYLSELETNRLQLVVAELATIYEQDGNWAQLTNNRRRWDELLRKGGDSGPGPGPPRRGPDREHKRPLRPPQDPANLRGRVALLDAQGRLVIGRLYEDAKARNIDIEVGAEKVGTLRIRPPNAATEQSDIRFSRQQSRSIAWIGVVVLAFAALIAAIISRQLVRPIAQLADGTKALASGDFDRRITVVRDDELGDLARDFNRLADTLSKNQQSRRQWVADISHELRTPLAILSGELQAIEDGVRQFDDGTRLSLQAEVQRLTKLVADLHELTTSDEGGLRLYMRTINIIDVVETVLNANRDRIVDAGLTLEFSPAGIELLIDGDEQRLEQLFSNLVENSLRYTRTPGTLDVGVSAIGDQVAIVFADSAPGVEADALPRLFDRLFRGDHSRNRASGGSGLGLSIAAAIVAGHGGAITATNSDLGGLEIRVTLPRRPDA